MGQSSPTNCYAGATHNLCDRKQQGGMGTPQNIITHMRYTPRSRPACFLVYIFLTGGMIETMSGLSGGSGLNGMAALPDDVLYKILCLSFDEEPWLPCIRTVLPLVSRRWREVLCLQGARLICILGDTGEASNAGSAQAMSGTSHCSAPRSNYE